MESIARADIVNGQVVDSKDVLFEIIDPLRLMVEASTADPTLFAKLDTAHPGRHPTA